MTRRPIRRPEVEVAPEVRENNEAKAQVLGYLEGARTWSVRRTANGWRLFAQFSGAEWPRGVFEAECRYDGAQQIHNDHQAPAENCYCGVQAVWPELTAEVEHAHGKMRRTNGDHVAVGTVHAWGTAITGTRGFRAGRASVASVEKILMSNAGNGTCQARPMVYRGKRERWACGLPATHIVTIDRMSAGASGSTMRVCADHAQTMAPAADRRECDVRDCHKRPAASVNGRWFSTCSLHAPVITELPVPAGEDALKAEIFRDLRFWYECRVPGDDAELDDEIREVLDGGRP